MKHHLRRTRGFKLGLSLLGAGAVFCLLTGVASAAPSGGTPTITGTAQQGQTLTANPGTWTGTGTVTFAYQWETCSPACTAISGQIGTTYVPTSGDVGHTIEVQVIATDSTGSAPAATSAPTAAVTGNSAPPTISGTAQQGQTLTVKPGTWTDGPTSVSEQWEDCTGATCTPITGQTATTYTLAAGDVGHTIEVLETATNAIGAATATSAGTAVVTGNSAPPIISGTAQQGQTLTVTPGTWTSSPLTVSEQWEDCTGATCTPITGQTGTTYTLAAGDVGHTIEVLETATNAIGAATASSAPTAAVLAPPAPASVTAPSISGTAEQGQTLTEVPGTWGVTPAAESFQWEVCTIACTSISGATGSSYVVQGADVGRTITVVETATNGGPSTQVASARTGLVTATSSTVLTVFAPSSPVTNQTVTLAATVSSNSGNADPTGSLSFLNGSSPIPGCVKQAVKSSGQSVTLICQTSFPANRALLSATYAPGAGSLVDGSSSPSTTLGIGRDATSTSLAVTSKVGVGGRAVYTATIVLPASNSGPVQPTGSIEFLDGGRPISACQSRPLSQLEATCRLSYRSRGVHKITAVYSGDPNFLGSTSQSRGVHIGRGSTSAAVLGFISSTLQWTFYYHPTYTQVVLLRAYGVTRGVGLLLTCHGPGCEFHKLRTSITDSPGCSRGGQVACASGSSINLMPLFRNRHLGVGTQVTVWFTHPHWIGKYYSFTIRPGRPPLIVLSCLGVGERRPGVGC